jgi:pyrroline-5-carboxylate reductase
MTTVGILGVGRLAEFLVAGLRRQADAPAILLSPRNAERAARLAERHGLEIAPDNAALVAASDIILLATRPAQAAEAVAGLPWRAGHLLVCLCAGVSLARLGPRAAPATIVRAMPLSAAAIGESPTCLYPDVAPARDLLSRLGPVISLPDEAAFEAASVSGAFYGWVHALIGEATDWCAAEGVPETAAREVMARTVGAAASMVLHQTETSFSEMMEELATPGGVTELGLETLREEKSYEAWRAACAAVLARARRDD